MALSQKEGANKIKIQYNYVTFDIGYFIFIISIFDHCTAKLLFAFTMSQHCTNHAMNGTITVTIITFKLLRTNHTSSQSILHCYITYITAYITKEEKYLF